MQKDEIIKKNISLTFDFIRNAVDNPDFLDKIPDNSEIDFMETDLPITYSSKTIKNKQIKPVTFKVKHIFCDIVAEKRL